MTQNTHDEHGDPYVNIIENPSTSSGGNGGFFGIGGGGGFGGGFGGTSRRRARKRAAHRQQVVAYSQVHDSRRAQLDGHFAQQRQDFEQTLQREIDNARNTPNSDGSERWQLYLITKARAELGELIAAKQQALAQRQATVAGFGDPQIAAEAYAARLAALLDAAQMEQLHRSWDAAYTAALDAQLLSQAIEQLTQRSAALLADYGLQQEQWKVREAEWVRQEQYAEQREARVRYKQQAEEDRRFQKLRHASTFTAPVVAANTAGVLLTQAGAQVATDLAAAIKGALANGVKAIERVLFLRGGVGPPAAVTTVAMLYSPSVGNGELSELQRLRHLEGLGVGAATLGLPTDQNLQAASHLSISPSR